MIFKKIFFRKLFLSRSVNYISIAPIMINAFSVIASMCVFGAIFLVAYFVRKKTKKWFSSEEGNKQKVQNINLDNSPDKNVETTYEKNKAKNEQNNLQEKKQEQTDGIGGQQDNKLIGLDGYNKQDEQSKQEKNSQNVSPQEENVTSDDVNQNSIPEEENDDNKKTDDVGEEILNLKNANASDKEITA